MEKVNFKKKIKIFLSKIGFLHPAFGCKISPQEKVLILLKNKSNLNIFVETGTHNGFMIDKMYDHFGKIYSVELDENLFRKTVKRFEGKDKIKILKGDSAEKIKDILSEIKSPALFWLDAHNSGKISGRGENPAPILEELKSVFNHPIKKHIIIIDDARHFDRWTISKIRKECLDKNFKFFIKDGLFLIHPSLKL